MFTIPAAMWLRPRPGPPLMANGRKGRLSRLSYLTYAWKSLFRTIKLARRLQDIMLFLGGWFLLSDAIATTSSTAILFAKTQLHMRPWALGLINVIVTLTGIFGAFGWSWVSRVSGLQAHQTILVCIALFELIPLYGLMGYLPFVQRWGVFGLQQPWEMYPLAAVYGLVMGGLSSYCRSLYGELIPPGSEAAFYALYAITEQRGPASSAQVSSVRSLTEPAASGPLFGFWGPWLASRRRLYISSMLNVARERVSSWPRRSRALQCRWTRSKTTRARQEGSWPTTKTSAMGLRPAEGEHRRWICIRNAISVVYLFLGGHLSLLLRVQHAVICTSLRHP